ncbi:MAG TPA: RNA-binding protein [Sedimenticola sp.]|nr:RNA-binding protein [Sedimenticola sp.]
MLCLNVIEGNDSREGKGRMNVLISNLPGDTSEEEVLEILKEHGVPVTKVTLDNEGNRERAVAVVEMDTDHAGAKALANMVNGRFWKGRTLSAQPMAVFTGEGLNE